MDIQGIAPDLLSIAQVKRAYASKLFGSRNVVACGVGFKETGGTFTDAISMNDKGVMVTAKTPTLPKDLAQRSDLSQKPRESSEPRGS